MNIAMQAALEILGYGPTIHGFNQWMHTRDTKMWDEGLKAKFSPSSTSKPFGRAEFDNLLGEYEVASDFPSLAFSEELIALYPEAKVIIVERDIDAWYKSFHDAIITKIFSKVIYAIVTWDPTLLAFHLLTRTWLRGYFGANSQEELEGTAKRVYREHYEMVRRVTPKERLLDFKLEMGWGPLCRFLGEDVPNMEFPRINDAKDFEGRSNVMIKIAATRALKKGLWWLGCFGAVGAGLWWYYN
jgi:hypothetical protein